MLQKLAKAEASGKRVRIRDERADSDSEEEPMMTAVSNVSIFILTLCFNTLYLMTIVNNVYIYLHTYFTLTCSVPHSYLCTYFVIHSRGRHNIRICAMLSNAQE